MLTILLVILWSYGAVVLALVAGEVRYRKDDREDQVPFTRLLQSAAVIYLLFPLLIWVARIDWYGDVE